MKKNFKEMTWALILGHLYFFVLGVIALVVVVVVVGYEYAPMENATIGVIAAGASITIMSVVSFLWLLFEKRKGEINPSTSQHQEHKKSTATH